ncbi:MAG TPA: hypothetical protein VEZ47_04050 [Gemmatirosa sp.]|nr:hypothetical protein [Gemmatirosa sp.]
MIARRRLRGLGVLAGLAGLAGLATGAAACVRIETAPEGVTSARLRDVGPSIVLGDTLRDSLGQASPLRAVAFGQGGDTLGSTGIRYFAVPIGTDTLPGGVLPVTVDSVSGVVVARPTLTAPRVRLSARLGARLQLLDTVDLVPRPDSMGVASGASTSPGGLAYLCADDRRTLDTVLVDGRLVGTASRPLGARLSGDSAGTRVGVRRYLVEYTIDAGRAVPAGLAPHGDRRPALYVTPAAIDVPMRFDTTGTDGTTRPRLRVVPTLLPRSAWPDTVDVRVTARARVAGRNGPEFVGAPVIYTVRLVRLPSTAGLPCP